MPDFQPIFRSPINPANFQPQSPPAALTLVDLTGAPVVLVQGQAEAVLQKQFGRVPAKPGDLTDVGDGLLARLTAREFYLFGRTPDASMPAVADLEEQLAHATDLTHGLAVLRLQGAQAAELLSKICGLDFHEAIFPSGRVAQTSAAKIKTLIARCDEGDTPTYFLHVDRPSGQYFWEVVRDAGQEFGLSVLPTSLS
jgi:heterotetrameric sarcosine oxidase gamma subunit